MKQKPKRRKRHYLITDNVIQSEYASSDDIEKSNNTTSEKGLKNINKMWGTEEGTDAPDINDDELNKKQYAKSPTMALDKYLLSKVGVYKLVNILLLLGFCFVSGWIFIHDNSKGILINWDSYMNFFTKCSSFGIIIAIVFIILNIMKKWGGKTN